MYYDTGNHPGTVSKTKCKGQTPETIYCICVCQCRGFMLFCTTHTHAVIPPGRGLGLAFWRGREAVSSLLYLVFYTVPIYNF